MSLRLVAVGICCGISVALAQPASAQDFPRKPIRLITSVPGGSGDTIARMVAQGISGPLAQQVIVDNRAGGVVPPDIVARAAPDGYTLLFYGNSLWMGSLMRASVPYDPVKDFAPITLVARSPQVLVVHPTVAANSIKELIALAKARPGELNYASSTVGSANHLAGELFNYMTGVKIVHVPYKGGGPAMVNLLGGEVQMMFPTATSVTSHIKAGKLRGLAVTSAQPSALAPGLPTVAASGLPGYEAVAIFGIFAPAKTPPQLIDQLNGVMREAINSTSAKDRFFNEGLEPVGSLPPVLTTAIRAEMSIMGKVIKQAGIKVE